MEKGGSQDPPGENGKVKRMQSDILQKIETMSRQRLNLVKQFNALSASALQCLDGGDIDGFVTNVDASSVLTTKIDELSASIDAHVSQLGSASAATVRALFASGAENVAVPEWCASLAYDSANMKKLLRNCTALNARMDARARAVSSEIREQLNRIRMNRKINNRYAAHGATAGMHINYRLK
jgi:hypothetical protein